MEERERTRGGAKNKDGAVELILLLPQVRFSGVDRDGCNGTFIFFRRVKRLCVGVFEGRGLWDTGWREVLRQSFL